MCEYSSIERLVTPNFLQCFFFFPPPQKRDSFLIFFLKWDERDQQPITLHVFFLKFYRQTNKKKIKKSTIMIKSDACFSLSCLFFPHACRASALLRSKIVRTPTEHVRNWMAQLSKGEKLRCMSSLRTVIT